MTAVQPRAARRARAGGPDAALKAELLGLTPDPDDQMNAACVDFLATRAEAGDVGLIVADWLRAARSSRPAIQDH